MIVMYTKAGGIVNNENKIQTSLIDPIFFSALYISGNNQNAVIITSIKLLEEKGYKNSLWTIIYKNIRIAFYLLLRCSKVLLCKLYITRSPSRNVQYDKLNTCKTEEVIISMKSNTKGKNNESFVTGGSVVITCLTWFMKTPLALLSLICKG